MTLPVDLLISAPGNNFNLKNDPDLNLSLTRGNRGDEKLTFDLCNWRNRLPGLGERIALRDPTYGFVWSGYAETVQPGGFFGKPAKIEANGWHYTIGDDGWDTTQVYAEGTNYKNVIMNAMSRMSGGVSAGIPLPAALTTTLLTEDSGDFILKSPEDVYNFICDKLKYQATPLMWEVRQSLYTQGTDDPSLYVRFLDLAPRYQVTLTENDDYGPSYHYSTVWNKAVVGWSPKLAEEYTVPSGSLYKVIPRIRAKRVNATNDISEASDAEQLAVHLTTRNNELRPANTVLTIHCDTPIEAQYPVVPSWTGNVPHYFVYSNFYIRVLNPTDGWGQYNIREHWISDATYDFDSGTLRLSLGDPIAYDTWPVQQSYQVSRVNSALESPVVNAPLRDADTIRTIGPDKAGDSPPTIGEAIPMAYLDEAGNFVSVTDITKPSLPYKAVIHPKVLPDYGVQANFGREADSIGVKGYIRVIPCKVWDWSLDFTPPAGSDVVPTDSVTVQLYPTYPFAVGVNILATCTIAASQGATGAIAASALQTFNQSGKIGVRVSVAAATAGSGFQIGIGGKKIYPDLGVTT